MNGKHSLVRWICCLVISLAFLISFDAQADTQYLKLTDIQQITTSMLQQHVEKRQINSEMLKNALKAYLEEFDPEKIYLLQGEVDQFVNLSSQDSDQAIGAFSRNDYTIFAQLNETIARAIDRSKKIRGMTLAEKRELMNEVAAYSPTHPFGQKKSYAKTEEELAARIRDYQKAVIAGFVSRFSKEEVLAKQDRVFDRIQRLFMANEEDYNQAMKHSDSEGEHQFSLLILKALAHSFDPHSSFYNANEAAQMRIRLEKGFKGIGVVFGENLDGFYVVELVDGGPAQRSGQIRANDELVEINGKNLEGMELDEVIQIIRENSENLVRLVLKRYSTIGGMDNVRTVSVSLMPEVIEIASNRVDTSIERFQDGIIGRITLHSFYEGENGVSSSKDVLKAINDFKKQGNLMGLVLDLRENSGGYLSQAVEVAGLFIKTGVVVVAKYQNGEKHFYRDLDSVDHYDGPLIVLTSKFTASAAEIVAQALQDYGVALVVGDEQTYGKGTIQAQTVTEGGGSSLFKVTVGKYYTVSGDSPQRQGVKADIIVPSVYNTLEVGEGYIDDSLLHDSIAPSFNDELSDVEGFAQIWYRRHYLPELQKKESLWDAYLSKLKYSSSARIDANSAYRDYVANGIGENADKFGSQGHLANDPQMKEAVQIMKDMIAIDSRVAKADSVEENNLKWHER